MHCLVRGIVALAAAAALVACSEIEPAKDFRLVPLQNPAGSVSLADFKGKTVLLDFWATWCGPCREMMPEVQSVWQTYHTKGLEVLAITDEKRERVFSFHEGMPYTYPIYLDPESKANEAYRVQAIPKFVLIRDGKILWVLEGAYDKGDLTAKVKESIG